MSDLESEESATKRTNQLGQKANGLIKCLVDYQSNSKSNA